MVRWRPGEGIWGYWMATSAVTEIFCTLVAILGSDAWRPANGSQQEDIVHEGSGLQAWWMFVAQRERENSQCFIVEGHLSHYKWYDYKHAHTTYTKHLTKQARPKPNHNKTKNKTKTKKQTRTKQKERGEGERQTDRDTQTETERDRKTKTETETERQRQTETDLIIHVYTCSMLRHTSTHMN